MLRATVRVIAHKLLLVDKYLTSIVKQHQFCKSVIRSGVTLGSSATNHIACSWCEKSVQKEKGKDVKHLLLKKLFLIQIHFVWCPFWRVSTSRKECTAHLEGSAVARQMPLFQRSLQSSFLLNCKRSTGKQGIPMLLTVIWPSLFQLLLVTNKVTEAFRIRVATRSYLVWAFKHAQSSSIRLKEARTPFLS